MRWTAAILAMGLLAWFAFAPHTRETERARRPSADPFVTSHSVMRDLPFAESRLRRFTLTLYPYSVIPGGVESVAELRSVLARDPILATHFEGFDLDRARLVRIDQPRSAYVSYRIGEHIYWTSRKLTLPKGEAVITDGAHTARARCGNLVAEIPMGPVSPREPTPRIFDVALPLDMPMGPSPDVALPPASEWAPKPPTRGTVPQDPGKGIYIVPDPFPIRGSAPLSNTPAVPTPEPDILILISVALAALLGLRLLGWTKLR